MKDSVIFVKSTGNWLGMGQKIIINEIEMADSDFHGALGALM
jgi:hypothetical protein